MFTKRNFVCVGAFVLLCPLTLVLLAQQPPAEAQNPPDEVQFGEMKFPNKGEFIRSKLFAESRARCATDAPGPFRQQLIIGQLRAFKLMETEPAEFKGVEIPVHVHVLHLGERGRVTLTQVDRQLEVLSKSFAPHRISFVTKSVGYIDDERWFSLAYRSKAEREVKQLLGKEQEQTLNLYIANLQPLGWATFPWDFEGDPVLDGIVIDFRTLPGGSADGYNDGMTAVHEVGHWLGLFHVFQGGCIAPGDHVDDTPAQADDPAIIHRCEEDLDSCPEDEGKDPVHNYMSYTKDCCLTNFTPGQEQRMIEHLRLYRPKLLARPFAPKEQPNAEPEGKGKDPQR